MCSQQLSVLQWMNNIIILKIYSIEFHNVFDFQKLLVEVTDMLLDSTRKNSCRETINSGRNGIN